MHTHGNRTQALVNLTLLLAGTMSAALSAQVVCSTGAGGDLTITGPTTIDTDTGDITPPGGVSPAFDGTSFNFANIDIQVGNTLTASGSQPLILLATGNVTVDGTIMAAGQAGESVVLFNLPGGAGGLGGPGGGDGGAGGGLAPGTGTHDGAMGMGPGGGGGAVCMAVTGSSAGGGGGGHMAAGAPGGTGSPSVPGAAGMAYASLPPLLGGSGGGGGSADDDTAPVGGTVAPGADDGAAGGGGGGGAVRIFAAGTLDVAGTINCSGGTGGANHGAGVDGGAGGGGSGGAIELLASVMPTAPGTLNVAAGPNGGSAPAIGGAGSVGRTSMGLMSCGPPPPTCTLTAPAGPVSGDVTVTLDSASMSTAMVDVSFDFSVDMGTTWSPCTAGAMSPIPNPAAGVATGMQDFDWDSRADGVGVAMIQIGALVRATVDDGASMFTGTCSSATFDVDNTALCGGICGDCDLNAMGPSILDALIAAQIAAGLVVPTPTQIGCCDVNASMTVDVLDALVIAQSAAGLPVVLTCL